MPDNEVCYGVDTLFVHLLGVVVALARSAVQVDDKSKFPVAVAVAYRFAVGKVCAGIVSVAYFKI